MNKTGLMVLIAMTLIVLIIVKADYIKARLMILEDIDFNKSISIIIMVGVFLIISAIAYPLTKSWIANHDTSKALMITRQNIINYIRETVKSEGIELRRCVFYKFGYWLGKPNPGWALIFTTNQSNDTSTLNFNFNETRIDEINHYFCYYISLKDIKNFSFYGHHSPKNFLRLLRADALGQFGVTIEPINPPKTGMESFLNEIRSEATKETAKDSFKRKISKPKGKGD